jgi:hypothetical protein
MNDLIDENEEEATAEFVEKFVREMTPTLKLIQQLIHSGMMSPEGLIGAQKEIFEGLALLCAGLPPHHKDEMIKRMAPQWAELVGLMNENRKAALRALAKRRVA